MRNAATVLGIIHERGEPTKGNREQENTGEPGTLKSVRLVRWGADGKGTLKELSPRQRPTRLSVGLCGKPRGSRRDQKKARRFPECHTQIGVITGENFDHARRHGDGTFPRL